MDNKSIIYCNTKRTSDWLKEGLEDRDFTVKCIHSNMKDRKEKLPLRSDALCAETMSIDHRAGAMDATHGQGKERKYGKSNWY